MRVAHVINRLVPGGAELQLQGLVERTGQDHVIVELEGEPRRSRSGAVWNLRGTLRTVGPDVVVGWLDRSQIAVAGVARRSLPLIAAVGGIPGRSDRIRTELFRLALRRYQLFVVNSAESEAAVRDFLGPRARPLIRIIPNAVETAGIDACRPSVAGPLRIAFVGRNDPAKGLDVLLSALALLDPGEVDVTLVGAGVPEAVARRVLQVETHAFPRTDDPWRFVQECDVLVLPSRTEGSPNVVIEAFARRLPVIGTAVGGTISLLKDGRGLLVQAEDPRALVTAIRAVGSGRAAAAQRAKDAYAYVREVHAWTQVVAAWEELLIDLARGRKRA